MIKKYDITYLTKTKFTLKEKKLAKNLEMIPTWYHGYPEPSDDFSYRETTYDIKMYCKECGSGKVQNAPYRLKKEPRWGRRGIMQLNWIFDEFFVRPEVWAHIFKPFDIKCREVLHIKTGKKLETVVQLIIPQEDVELNLDEYLSETCTKCNVKRYLPINRGFMPSLKTPVNRPIFKSKEYFGSGHSSTKAVIVSNELFKSINEKKLKGVDFKPLKQ